VQTLPFSQDWSNTALITADDNWSGVAGITGYRGDGLTGSTGIDPQTVLADGSSVVDVNANRADPNTFTTGGVAEFQLTNPVIALQGSGTARAPHIVATVSTAGLSNIRVAYNLRDIDGSADNAVQPVALQFRVGTSGNYTNVPAAFVADASSGPSVATLVTPVNVALPAAAANQVALQIRIITTDAAGSDEWIGIDDLNVTGSTMPGDTAPMVASTTPANGATGVPIDASVGITFTESVNAGASAFAIACAGSPQQFVQSASPSNTFTLTLTSPLPYSTNCAVTVTAAQITDTDLNPPDEMGSNFTFSFTTALQPPAGAAKVIINEIDADTPSADTAEFIELYDGGAGNTPLDGLVVVLYNGSNDLSYAAFDLDGYSTDSNGYFTLGNPGVAGVDLVFDPGPSGLLQNGADAVAVYIGSASDFPLNTPITTANLVDAIAYDTDDPDDSGLLALLNAGQPQVNENGGGNAAVQSIQRCPNGSGGRRNTSTYLARTPTPGGANTCLAPPPPSNSAIVISQIYGGGGNAGAVFQNDYVELYNRGTTTMDITGWSLQYASASGSGWDFTKQPLGGKIAAGEYYLIALASGGNDGSPLPAANIQGQINMSGTNGKIALVRNFDGLVGNCPTDNPDLMDLVGYGNADCREGTATAPAASNTTALFRVDDGNIDTNQNGSDFISAFPAPRRTAPIVELGPLVVSTDPRSSGTNAPRDATIEITFTEPVNVDGAWFDISCTSSGLHSSATFAANGASRYITPNVNFTPGETCTVTLFKDQVTDQDTDDSGPNTDTLPANYTWSFAVATGTAPPYPQSVHLAMGNPSSATTADEDNYLMEKPEYTLSYNRSLGRPNWVSWHLSDEWVGTLTRFDTFRPDPAIPPDWYRVQSFDFAGTGFDRGHMVPNADRDKETSIPINQATFLMSNMLAQAPDNNQGPWAALENELRTLLVDNELYIVAGGAGTGGTGSNGEVTNLAGGHVSVPAWTWKAALVIPKGSDDVSRVSCSTRTIAVIMPNVQGIRDDPWQDYLTTVDAVEALTGYDLFSNLPEPIQKCFEAGINGDNPLLEPSFTELDAPTIEGGTATTVISGKISAGTFIPTGIVAVTVGAAPTAAAIGADGRFTATVSTGTLPVGSYPISFSYDGDATFGGATGSSMLKVIDTTAPAIAGVTTTPSSLGAPNHTMIDMTVGYTATDFSGTPTCSLSVSSSEPVNGLGDGNTSPDWYVVDAQHVQLRAERSGMGTARIYTITITCTDSFGNTSTSADTVTVSK